MAAPSGTPCAAASPCQVATCDAATGQCITSPAANGTPCSDGNACTQSDTCGGGVCQPGSPVVCGGAGSCQGTGVCNPATGQCSSPALPNGTACDDGNACTMNDGCQNGSCVAGTSVKCLAASACHDAGVCNPSTGQCSSPAKTNGAACDDANACTQGDSCQSGACKAGAPVVCQAADACHTAGTCNPATGLCSQPQKANGSSCEDGNPCTLVDSCQAGACIGGDVKDCTSGKVCISGSCNPNGGGTFGPPLCDQAVIPGFCIINGKECVTGGAQSNTSPCDVCAPSKNQLGWTKCIKGSGLHCPGCIF